MSKSIYKRLIEDFAFLKEYGYFYYDRFEFYRRPFICFRNKKRDEELSIGYAVYGEIHAGFYCPANSNRYTEEISFSAPSYEKQVGKLKELLYARLNEKEMTDSQE